MYNRVMDEIAKNLKVSITRDDTYEYPIHCHSHWEIMSYLSGEGVMKTEKGNIPFEKGTVICMPPTFLHGSTAKKTGFKNISLGSNRISLPSSEPIVFGGQAASEIRTVIDTVYKLYYRDAIANAAAIEKLIDATGELIVAMLKATDAVYLGSVVESLKNAIVTNFTDYYFSVSDEISKLAYTDDYIRTLFKSATGKTPLRYLTDMRLNHADNMLKRNPREKITTVALCSGFSDPLYFTRAYKKRYGISPSQRKEELKNEED